MQDIETLSYPHSLDEEDLCESSMGSSGANVFSSFVSCIKNMYLIDRTSVYLVAAMIVLSIMCKQIDTTLQKVVREGLKKNMEISIRGGCKPVQYFFLVKKRDV